MTPEDLYRLSWADDPRLSPDGRTAAVAIWRIDPDENDYASAIWLVAVDGSERPRRLTAGEKQDAAPRWSPDGERLAFVSNRASKTKQLYVLPVGGGEPQRLTELDEDVADVSWSPDGARLAFSSRVRDPAYEEQDDRRRRPRRITRLLYKLDDVGWTADRRRHVFVVPADGSEPPRTVTDGDYEDEGPAWSPDGSRIAFTSARDDDWDVKLVSDLYVVPAEGGEPVRLTEGESIYEAPSWSPDGASIACRWRPGGFDWPRHGRIAVVDARSGERHVLTAGLDRNCAPYPPMREPVWEGGAIVFPVEDGGNTHVYRAPADGSAPPEAVVTGECWVTGYDAVGGTLAYTASRPAAPAELFVGGRALTEAGAALARLVDAERFTARHADGSEIDAWVVRPAGFEPGRRYPVLLGVHGGPYTQYGNKFFDEFQVYAGAGYAVVFSNPRGSSGYGEEWGRAIRGPVEGGPGWGTVDYEDLMAVVDEALRRFDFCDPDRLGVLGGSYGGYMTSWIVSHTDRFRAACSERAVNDLYAEFGSSDIGWSFKSYTGAFPFEDPQAHLRHSPVTYARDIHTPLLILHSENDLRCPVGQGEELFAILRLLGREVELVRFPSESHELTRSGSPAHRVMRFEVLLDWFERRL